MRIIATLLVTALGMGGCSPAASPDATPAPATSPTGTPSEAAATDAASAWPAGPVVPDGEVTAEAAAAVDRLIAATVRASFDRDALAVVAEADDARLG